MWLSSKSEQTWIVKNSDARTAIVRRPRDAPFKRQIAFAIGNVLARALPARSHSIVAGSRAEKLLDRLIRRGIQGQAIREGDHARLRDLLRNYWRREGLSFGSEYAFRFKEQFLERDSEVVYFAIEALAKCDLKIVVEFGCGNGKVLEYVSQKLPCCEELIGIDISPERIEANKGHYHDPRLKFVANNALDWIRTYAKPSMMLMANGGVLEYFLKEEVEEVFDLISRHEKTAIALIETVGSDHDLENDSDTHPYGRELAFSHNYVHLLTKAGFEVQYFTERPGEYGDRWVRVFATCVR